MSQYPIRRSFTGIGRRLAVCTESDIVLNECVILDLGTHAHEEGGFKFKCEVRERIHVFFCAKREVREWFFCSFAKTTRSLSLTNSRMSSFDRGHPRVVVDSKEKSARSKGVHDMGDRLVNVVKGLDQLEKKVDELASMMKQREKTNDDKRIEE